MAFDGKKSVDTLNGVSDLVRTTTSVPESTQKSTNFEEPSRITQTVGLSEAPTMPGNAIAESSAERERRQRLSTIPPPSRRVPSHTAAFPGRAERRIFDGEKNSQPPPYARRLSSRPSVPARESAGYYSLRDEQLEEVKIPRAPRVPLDFEEIDPELIPAAFVPQSEFSNPESIRSAAMEGDTFQTIRTPPPSRRTSPPSRRDTAPTSQRDTAPTPPRDTAPTSRRDTMRSTIPPPSRSQVSTRNKSLADFDSPRFDELVRPTDAPPRIYFSPHVRRQANDWSETGSLSIPGCSSPRHARALQRALLLALLTDPGWDALPEGLKQRAGWLFNEGWESNVTEGRAFREIDDLATMLSLEASPQSRATLARAVAAVVPASRRSRSTNDLPPSSRRR